MLKTATKQTKSTPFVKLLSPTLSSENYIFSDILALTVTQSRRAEWMDTFCFKNSATIENTLRTCHHVLLYLTKTQRGFILLPNGSITMQLLCFDS